MPIRLNLMAEAQAAEDQRRRDPVKRAIWIGGFLATLMLLWSGSLQLKASMAKRDLSKVQDLMKAHTNDFREVQDSQKKVNEMKFKLENLRQLSANRFLNGPLLNALQQATVDDVQLVHVRADQNYTYFEGTKSRTNDSRVLPGKPPTWTEKIAITLDGNDTSNNPGDQVIKFKDTVATHSYFEAVLAKTNQVNLKGWGTVQVSPETGRQCMLFTVECRLPEKTR